uniref:Uncharacterized protein n=1 Tax=Oryza sativa subsp. japonica TaxID=39947 RepID=Q6KAI3_ORYSJ|nr:hypothetical protein [Oryza sativa Japonica Group]
MVTQEPYASTGYRLQLFRTSDRFVTTRVALAWTGLLDAGGVRCAVRAAVVGAGQGLGGSEPQRISARMPSGPDVYVRE